MSKRPIDQTQLVQAQALAKLLGMIVPQAFTSDEVMDEGDGRKIDEWKMTKFSGRAMMSLLHFRHRGENDGVRFYKELVQYFLRGSHSIDGTGLKMLESISVGLVGGRSRGKIVKKPGWIGRNVTQKDWERKAREEGSEIAE